MVWLLVMQTKWLAWCLGTKLGRMACMLMCHLMGRMYHRVTFHIVIGLHLQGHSCEEHIREIEPCWNYRSKRQDIVFYQSRSCQFIFVPNCDWPFFFKFQTCLLPVYRFLSMAQLWWEYCYAFFLSFLFLFCETGVECVLVYCFVYHCNYSFRHYTWISLSYIQAALIIRENSFAKVDKLTYSKYIRFEFN